MEIRGTTRLIGLFGHPVAHSLSPAMHNAAFARLGLDLCYVPLDVEPARLPQAVEALRALGFRGANVTIPHKQAVLALLDEVSALSRLLGAVNTITNEGGRLRGDTTDPAGFEAGFREAGHGFAGKSVAILGNGGSARTLAFHLALAREAARLLLVARDGAKARALADEVAAATGARPETCTLREYPDYRRGIQVVVNATPVGMHPHPDASPLEKGDLEPGQVVYDLIYRPEETLLLRYARERGAAAVGGLGMLVHQALASFRQWTGAEAEAAWFYAGARAQLAARG